MKYTKSITTQDFNKICRFCAKSSSELKPIFKSDDFGDNRSLEENVSVPYLFQNSLNLDVCAFTTRTSQYYDLLNSIDHLQVITDERLPLLICTSCNRKLTNANNFRQQCLATYQFLLGIYENESKGNESDDKNAADEEDMLPATPVNSFYFLFFVYFRLNNKINWVG